MGNNNNNNILYRTRVTNVTSTVEICEFIAYSSSSPFHIILIHIYRKAAKKGRCVSQLIKPQLNKFVCVVVQRRENFFAS